MISTKPSPLPISFTCASAGTVPSVAARKMPAVLKTIRRMDALPFANCPWLIMTGPWNRVFSPWGRVAQTGKLRQFIREISGIGNSDKSALLPGRPIGLNHGQEPGGGRRQARAAPPHHPHGDGGQILPDASGLDLV